MERISIKKPIAYPNERVRVLNYNRRPKIWEDGIVYNTESSWNDEGNVQHSYRVRLDRKSANDNLLFLHVNNDGIQKL